MLNITPLSIEFPSQRIPSKTGSELINEHIVLEAKRLLIATTNQVNQVADLLGYDDPILFIRFFKKHTGLLRRHSGRTLNKSINFESCPIIQACPVDSFAVLFNSNPKKLST